MATATFHPFPRLPFELRAYIWELTVEPRIVEVRVIVVVKKTEGRPRVRHLRSPTPAPAQVQTCREAREHLSRHPDAGYQKAFSEVMTKAYGGFDPVPEGDGERDRYVWLDLDIDVVSIGETYLDDLWAIAGQIRRLHLVRDISCEYFSYTESLLIRRLFVCLVELRLTCAGFGGVRGGYQATEDFDLDIEPENVYYLEPEWAGRKMISSVDLDALIDMEEDKFDETIWEKRLNAKAGP
jgi:hypothetical protein